MKIYISFGQTHVHSVNGKKFDKDCLAEIECSDYEDGRKKAFEYFGPKFFTSYTKEQVDGNRLSFFPRGVIPV
jgi:hypothetical protein